MADAAKWAFSVAIGVVTTYFVSKAITTPV
jgi:hypothetical protein